MKNRRGWIAIVEAVIAVLLVAAVLLSTVEKGNVKPDISEGVSKIELSILREIQNKDDFRKTILDIPEVNFPINWDNVNFPNDIKNNITYRTPNYLICQATICMLCEEEVCNIAEDGLPCDLGKEIEIDIYSQSVLIHGVIKNSEDEPIVVDRRLKLFCWAK